MGVLIAFSLLLSTALLDPVVNDCDPVAEHMVLDAESDLDICIINLKKKD